MSLRHVIRGDSMGKKSTERGRKKPDTTENGFYGKNNSRFWIKVTLTKRNG